MNNSIASSSLLQNALKGSWPSDVEPWQRPSDTQTIKKLTTDGFLEFCMTIDSVGSRTYQPTWFHEVLTSRLQQAYDKVARGEKVRLIIQCPPRHGKTRAATTLFPAWVLGKADYPIIACSYSADLAEKFGGETRDVMESSQYKKIFQARLRQDMTAKGNWATSSGGSYLATGVGGGITGKGFKIGIVDDPFKNREQADSEVYREMVWSWWTSTFYTRQEGRTAIIVIATRWHMDDLIGRLLQQQEDAVAAGLTNYDKWDVISFPAIAEEDEKYRVKGAALWPEKFSVDDLQQYRTNDVYEWSSLYQQSPILQANAEFQKHWFRYYEEPDIKNLVLDYTTTVDLAVSQKKSADNTVVMTVAKDTTTGKVYVIEETSGRLDPLQTIDAIFYHYNKYRSRVYIESVAYQAALKYFIEEEMRKRKIFFSVEEIKRSNALSKESRIRGLIPLYKTGMVYHRKSLVELEREMMQFPKGKHDDRLDALAMQTEILRATKMNTKEPVDNEPFDRFTTFG